MGVGLFSMPGSVLYHPSGADDAAGIARLYTDGASWVQLVAGQTYTFASFLAVPSGGRLSGFGATINSTISNASPSPTNCPIYIDIPAGQVIGSTTLASTPAVGATSLSITGAIITGQVIALAHGTSYEVFQAGTVTGSGPYSVPLLDDKGQPRALRQPFVSGDPVEVYAANSRPHDIIIEGITFTGTGAQCIEVARSLRVIVRDCILAPATSVTGLGFDVGCEACIAERVHCVVQGSGSNAGAYIQSNIWSSFLDCTSEDGPNGLMLLDCYECEIVGGGSSGCSGYGVTVGSLPNAGTASFGCIDCVVRDTEVFNCNTGYLVVGSTSLLLNGCGAESCAGDGILVTTQATTPTADRTRIYGCETKACGTGLLVNASVTNTTVRDHDSTGCTTAGASLSGDTVLDGLTALSMGVVGVTVVATNVRLSRLNIVVTTGGVQGVQLNGTNAWIADSIVTVANGAAAIAYYLITGTLRMRDCKAVGSTSSTALYVTASCRADLSGVNDLDGCPTTVNNNGTTTVAQASGDTALTITTADATLTWAQAQLQGIATSGTLTGNHNVILPTIAGMAWDVYNNNAGAFTTTFKTASGTGIAPAQGKRQRLKCDGTNIVGVSAAN